MQKVTDPKKDAFMIHILFSIVSLFCSRHKKLVIMNVDREFERKFKNFGRGEREREGERDRNRRKMDGQHKRLLVKRK